LLQVLVFFSGLVELREGGWRVFVLYKRVKACFVVLSYASSTDLRANNPEIRAGRVLRWWAEKHTDVRNKRTTDCACNAVQQGSMLLAIDSTGLGISYHFPDHLGNGFGHHCTYSQFQLTDRVQRLYLITIQSRHAR